MKIIFIAWKNCWQKAGATTLTLLLLSFGVGIISMMLLLENQLSEKFNKNIKDIDFVLGAKGSPLQLILANVYTSTLQLETLKFLRRKESLKIQP